MDTEIRSQNSRAVISEIGGEMISFKNAKGQEMIWQGDPSVWTGHGPVLFPVIGALKDGKISINGQTHDMTRHGIARRERFLAEKVGQNFVSYVLRSDENSPLYAAYPFKFALHVIHTVRDDGFTTEYLVENLDEKPLPFNIGGHPAFNCPVPQGESYEDYDILFEQQEKPESLLPNTEGFVDGVVPIPEMKDGRTLPLTHDYFDRQDTLIFENLNSKSVQLKNRKTDAGLEFEFPDFTNLAIWSKDHRNAPYVCIEPWNGTADLVNATGKIEDKSGLITLEPGTCWKGEYRARFF